MMLQPAVKQHADSTERDYLQIKYCEHHLWPPMKSAREQGQSKVKAVHNESGFKGDGGRREQTLH